MNTTEILQTVQDWASERFTASAGRVEVSERTAPPPFVDLRATNEAKKKQKSNKPNRKRETPNFSGVFFGFWAEPTKSLQIWLAGDFQESAYVFLDENDPEVWTRTFPGFLSSTHLKNKLSEVADLFMRTVIFEPALDEWVDDASDKWADKNGGSSEFQEIRGFRGSAAKEIPDHSSWTFFRYVWPGAEEVAVVGGFNGAGTAATFYEPLEESDGLLEFEDRTSGLQNATQFKSWLKRAVGRPSTMGITGISITNLFGKISYKIPLKTGCSATIIHAPNGYGKTTLLNLVYNLLKGRFGELCRHHFESLRLDFDDERSLVLEQIRDTADYELAAAEERSRRRRSSAKSSTTRFVGGNEEPVKRLAVKLIGRRGNPLVEDVIELERGEFRSRLQARSIAIRVAARTSHLRASGNGIYDSNSGETLSYEEVAERHASLESAGANRWLQALLARNEVRLIQTKRLDVEVVPDRERLSHREETELVPAVVIDAKQISETINKKLAEFSNISRKLDGDFLSELISSEPIEVSSQKELQEWLSEVAQKYERVAKAGILQASAGNTIPSLPEAAAGDPTITRALGLYVDNQLKKLKVFDDLLSKIETLKDLINDRFQMKSLEVSAESGYRVVQDGSANSVVPLDRLSSGEQHQLVLFYSLVFGIAPGALIMIDEPEISLHVDWQQVFLRDLKRIAKNTGAHFLIATHSPQIIDDDWDLTVSLAEQVG